MEKERSEGRSMRDDRRKGRRAEDERQVIEKENGQTQRRESSKGGLMHTAKTVADQVVFIRILQTERFVVSTSLLL